MLVLNGIRVTGCNGKIVETTATIVNKYQQFSAHWVQFITTSGLKCGNLNYGKIKIYQEDGFDTSNLAPASNLKYPLRWQITNNVDPLIQPLMVCLIILLVNPVHI